MTATVQLRLGDAATYARNYLDYRGAYLSRLRNEMALALTHRTRWQRLLGRPALTFEQAHHYLEHDSGNFSDYNLLHLLGCIPAGCARDVVGLLSRGIDPDVLVSIPADVLAVWTKESTPSIYGPTSEGVSRFQ